MPRTTSVLDHLWRELEGSPLTPIPDLSRKYAVPEGMIFEHLRSKGVAKVRKDCWGRTLEGIRSWGTIRLRVRNDGAAVDLTVASDRLHWTETEITAEGEGLRLNVRFNSVAAIYFLEDFPGCMPTVVFCNKRGRCVLEVYVERSEHPLKQFRETRDATCVGYLEGPTPEGCGRL